MAVFKNTLNLSALADGTVITGGNNTAGGDVLAGSGTASICTVSSTTAPAHGSYTKSAKFTPVSTTDVRTLLYSGFADTAMGGRALYRFTAYPGTGNSLTFLEISTSTGVAGAQLFMNGAGAVLLYGIGGTGGTTLATAGTIPLNTWVWFDLRAAVGTTTSNGQIWASWGTGDAAATNSVNTGATVNTGTTTFANVQFGKFDGLSTQAFYMSDVYVNTASSAAIGPWTAPTNSAPTASAGANQYVLAGTVVSLTGTDSDPDGTVTARAWTNTEKPVGAATPTITGGTTASASFTAATAGRYVFKYVVTDNLSAVSPDSFVTIYVYPASGATVNVYSVTLSAWTLVGAANAPLALNDSDPATYLESPTLSPSGSVTLATMCPYGPGTITVTSSGYYTGAAVTRRVQVYKEDGLTLINTFDITLTSSDADYVLTVDAAGLALIPALSDRRALIVKTTSSG